MHIFEDKKIYSMKPIFMIKAISVARSRFLNPQKAILTLGCVAVFNLTYAQIAVKWTFETSTPATSGPIAPETGSGEANCFHASSSTTYSNPFGNGSAESYGSNNWVAGEYYQFHASTLGLTNVGFAFDQTSSDTGPESFLIQVSTNGTTFTSLAGSNYDVTNDSWTASASNYQSGSHHYFSIPQLDNQADVYVRITLAAGSTAVNGSLIAATGTSRVDNVVIGTSTALPVLLQEFSLRDALSGSVLQWKTAMEKHLNYFSIEKSLDGKVFSEIDKVAATNDIHGSNYQFIDKYTSQNVCYRLRVLDESGESTLSNIVFSRNFNNEIRVTCPGNIIADNQPLLVNINGDKLYYWIVSNEGKVLSHGEDANKGTRTILIDLNEVANGLYFLKTSVSGIQQTFRILKQ